MKIKPLVLGLGVAALLSTPVPGALLSRRITGWATRRIARQLEPGAPEVQVQRNLSYGTGLLDVYRRPGMVGVQPTVVWVHGGSWIAGDRSDYAGYYARLADAGFTVVSTGYSFAPEHTHPTAVQDLNRAHTYLLNHGEHLGVDVERIILAGDSAGAQLASELAVAVTNPAAASAMGMTPALSPTQLKGVVLHCGVYDVPAMKGIRGIIAFGDRLALWAYTGVRDFASSRAAWLMSTINWVNADFPTTFITGGGADPLTENQSKPLARKLREYGVSVEEHFYPGLAHEFQFDPALREAHLVLARTIEFLRRVSR